MTLSDRLKRLVEFDPEAWHTLFKRKSIAMAIPHGAFSGAQVENARLMPLIHQLIQFVELADICTDKIASYGIPIKFWNEVCQPFEVALAALEDEVKKMEESK